MLTVARALCLRPRDDTQIAAARDQISSGNGASLFDALLEANATTADDLSSSVGSMMRLLETLMLYSPSTAGYLMGRLYSTAARYKLHHICDSIELWMCESADLDLAANLARLAVEGVRPRTQKLYEAWAMRIRVNSEQKRDKR